jgi:RHS repeat-associated protein
MTGNAETAAAVTAMTYDLDDHLTAIDATGSANDATFTIDALGRFRTRVLASSTDTYSYVGTSETVTRIANSGGTTTDSVVRPAGDRLGVKVSSTVNWFLPDLHGDIAASLDSGETTVVNAIRYDAYGQTITTGTAGGTWVGADTWTYQGRLDVSPSGLGTPLYDMSARFYDPGIGAFTQFDTIMGTAQNSLSMNRFLYAAANPATLIDPTGHSVVNDANGYVCPKSVCSPANKVKAHRITKAEDDRESHRIGLANHQHATPKKTLLVPRYGRTLGRPSAETAGLNVDWGIVGLVAFTVVGCTLGAATGAGDLVICGGLSGSAAGIMSAAGRTAEGVSAASEPVIAVARGLRFSDHRRVLQHRRSSWR